MSGSNLDLVRRIFVEFNETLELPRWALRDDIEWRPPSDEPDNAMRFGADAVTAYVSGWVSSFDDYSCGLDELSEHGDRVVASIHLHGRLGIQGQPLSIPLTQVWTVSNGQVVCVDEYRTRDEALAAIGSEPLADSRQ
jgi:ketosteroid isomerase-like protein